MAAWLPSPSAASDVEVAADHRRARAYRLKRQAPAVSRRPNAAMHQLIVVQTTPVLWLSTPSELTELIEKYQVVGDRLSRT